jgi:hypothetical protein
VAHAHTLSNQTLATRQEKAVGALSLSLHGQPKLATQHASHPSANQPYDRVTTVCTRSRIPRVGAFNTGAATTKVQQSCRSTLARWHPLRRHQWGALSPPTATNLEPSSRGRSAQTSSFARKQSRKSRLSSGATGARRQLSSLCNAHRHQKIIDISGTRTTLITTACSDRASD